MMPEVKIIKMYPEREQMEPFQSDSLKAIEEEMLDIVEQIQSTLKL